MPRRAKIEISIKYRTAPRIAVEKARKRTPRTTAALVILPISHELPDPCELVELARIPPLIASKSQGKRILIAICQSAV